MNKFSVRLPGWALMVCLAVLSTFVSGLIEIGGKHPLEAVLVAIIFGIVIKNSFKLPNMFLEGIRAFEVILSAGIILLGLSLSFSKLFESAAEATIVVTICIIIAPVIIYFLGKWGGLSTKLALLIGVGTTICGGTAIAIVGPIINAEEDEIAYSIGTVALFGLAAIFVLPVIGNYIGLGEREFGMWVGTAIHSTPQVLAGGYIYGEHAGEIATITKLFRNIYIIPCVMIMSLYQARVASSSHRLSKSQILTAVPVFLFGFLALVALRTIGDYVELLPADSWSQLIALSKTTAKFLILSAMAGIGLRTDLKSMKNIGLRPFFVGLSASIVLAFLSIIIIKSLQ